MKFIECLNDCWDYFFLGDPSNISKFKLENNLPDDLISELTQNNSGDLIVEKGVLIPLCGINNYPYHIYFQVDSDKSIFEINQSFLQIKKAGYLLEVINKEIYLMTIPYLNNWTEGDGIKALKSNGIRPKINLDNGFYNVEIYAGETNQETGLEPTIEFILKKVTADEAKFDVENINFRFEIKSSEY